MKHILFAFLALLALAARAEKADSSKPTEINSDKMTYDDVKQVNTYTGNVELTRGTLKLQAGRVVLTQSPEGYQFAVLHAAPGKLATFRQKRDGGREGADLWVEGHAERIEYDGKVELVKLFSKAKLTRLEGAKPTDEVEGEFISYDSRTEFFTVNNSPAGDSKGGARVKAVIQPRAEAKQAADAAGAKK